MLFVEHDMDMVHDISDWVIVMAEGRVIAEGTPDEIVVEPGRDRRLPRRPPGPVAAARSCEPRRPTSRWQRRVGPRRRRELVAGYIPEVNILNGCNLVVNEGEFVGIIGPNGAGKSTLLKAVLGLCTVRGGTIELDGERHHRARKAHELVAHGRRLRAAEQATCSRRLTVRENLEMGCFLQAVDVRRALRVRHRRCSRACGERAVAAGRRAVGRRAADGGDGPGADDGADACCCSTSRRPASRRALQDEVFVQCRRINQTGVAILMVEQNARRCLQVCTAATCSTRAATPTPAPAASCSPTPT